MRRMGKTTKMKRLGRLHKLELVFVIAYCLSITLDFLLLILTCPNIDLSKYRVLSGFPKKPC